MAENKPKEIFVEGLAKTREIIISAKLLLLHHNNLRTRRKSYENNRNNQAGLCAMENNKTMSQFISNKKVKRMFQKIYSAPLHVRVQNKGLDFLYQQKNGNVRVIHFTFKSFLYYESR